jgi:hypothetical protein
MIYLSDGAGNECFAAEGSLAVNKDKLPPSRIKVNSAE